MPKTFIIKDEDGKKFEITETTDDEEVEASDECVEPKIKDDEGLTPDEVSALKELAKHASDLIALLEAKKEAKEEVSDEEKEEDKENIVDEEKEELKDDEEIVDTKDDATEAIGSIEKSKACDSISDVDRDNEIANAWSNRFKQSYKGE